MCNIIGDRDRLINLINLTFFLCDENIFKMSREKLYVTDKKSRLIKIEDVILKISFEINNHGEISLWGHGNQSSDYIEIINHSKANKLNFINELISFCGKMIIYGRLLSDTREFFGNFNHLLQFK